MSRSCNKEQLLVFIVRQSITLKHAILSLISGPWLGSTSYLQSPCSQIYINTQHSVLVEVVELVEEVIKH